MQNTRACVKLEMKNGVAGIRLRRGLPVIDSLVLGRSRVPHKRDSWVGNPWEICSTNMSLLRSFVRDRDTSPSCERIQAGAGESSLIKVNPC